MVTTFLAFTAFFLVWLGLMKLAFALAAAAARRDGVQGSRDEQEQTPSNTEL